MRGRGGQVGGICWLNGIVMRIRLYPTTPAFGASRFRSFRLVASGLSGPPLMAWGFWLESEFGGTQPEDCIIAQQAVVLRPGNYAMSYSYPHPTSLRHREIHWQIVDAKTGTVWRNHPIFPVTPLLSSGFGFSVSTAAPLLQLRLYIRRALGTARIQVCSMCVTQIQAIPKTDLSRLW